MTDTYKKSECVAGKIRDILQRACPAARFEPSHSATWHGCFCAAQTGYSVGSPAHCDCVWHLTDTCLAGTWSELGFLNVERERQSRVACDILAKAKAAAARGQ